MEPIAVRMVSEEARLNALVQLNLLDTPPSESFDRITRMASQIFNLPVAAVSLTDRDRQWFKSRVGVEHWSIPRDKAPCSQVAECADIVVIPDFKKDPWYADSVLGQSGIRFYAGAPLVTREGHGLGALCVLGTEPREVTEMEVAALKDLAAIVMAQIELQHAFGRIDPLSGLPNRSQFLDDLADLASDADGTQRLAALVELARPEQISAYGRVMGSARVDDLVRDAAHQLGQLLEPKRTIYHVGFSQFAFLAPVGVDEDSYIGELTTKHHEERQRSSAGTMMTSAIGLVSFQCGQMPPQDVLSALQSAVQDARSSPEHVSLYSLQADEAHRRRFALLRDFEAALASLDQLRLVYQPRIDLGSGRCVGAEALLRWTHPVLGNVSPGEFIPIIEHSSFAKPMTAFVIDTALKQLRNWKEAGAEHLVLSINVSAANLHEPQFAEALTKALARHGVEAEHLELEVTESAVMQDADQAGAQLQALSDAGVRLAIDDFGTGYSSLAYLQKLPVQVVKIDQSFIRNMDQGAKEQSLVRSMISLTQDLGYIVVAEGIETLEAASLLRTMKCDEGQGYLFARPLEPEKFSTWLEEKVSTYGGLYGIA
jgi:EAL domain-containing protein (putative c-di-GMP-specific phosphodiesterase class I)/GGDEF domain-containing protein